MRNNLWWSQGHRGLRKCLETFILTVKELAEGSWLIYGMTLYFSSESDGCSDENQGFMIVMLLFLIIGALKLILIVVVICILISIAVNSRLKRRNERNASKDILRSLAKTKYSALSSIAQGETDEECSICFMAFGEDDIVTKLDCNEKHIFHEDCISAWIRQGKNSCPI